MPITGYTMSDITLEKTSNTLVYIVSQPPASSATADEANLAIIAETDEERAYLITGENQSVADDENAGELPLHLFKIKRKVTKEAEEVAVNSPLFSSQHG